MSGGHRSAAARRWISPTAVIAALLPLLTVAALAAVRPATAPDTEQPAEEVRPARVDLVCPSALGDPGLAVAAAGGDLDGEVTQSSGPGRAAQPVRLRSDTVTTVRSPRVTRLRGTGGLASEMIGSRFAAKGLSATECVFPRSDYWFSGVGAGAQHASVLELSNPDEGPAVADVTLWAPGGPLDVAPLRGVTVPGGESVRLELSQEIPRRTELGAEVVVSRGRLTASVEDTVPPLGSRPTTRGWLPESAPPDTDQLLLGLVEGDGSDVLALTNPGENEARVELRVVTEDATFVPKDQEEIRVAAGSVARVPVSATLRQAIRDGALGLELVASSPVAATLRSIVDGDLVHAVPVSGTTGPMTALVPPGDARLVLARAGGAGVAVVTAYGRGKQLAEKRVELTDGSGGTVDLPKGTDLVRVSPQRTDVSAAVVVTGGGATAVPLQELVRRSLVPDVRPGLP